MKMKISEFLRAFETEVVSEPPGTVTLDTKLEDLAEWDSMATVVFIAMTDEKLGSNIKIESLDECRTVGDLAALVRDHLEEG